MVGLAGGDREFFEIVFVVEGAHCPILDEPVEVEVEIERGQQWAPSSGGQADVAPC